MENKANPPEHAQIVKTIGPWDIYYLPEENAFYIQTEDYHALPLKMLKSEVLDLLADVERTNELIQKEDGSLDDKST